MPDKRCYPSLHVSVSLLPCLVLLTGQLSAGCIVRRLSFHLLVHLTLTFTVIHWVYFFSVNKMLGQAWTLLCL